MKRISKIISLYYCYTELLNIENLLLLANLSVITLNITVKMFREWRKHALLQLKYSLRNRLA